MLGIFDAIIRTVTSLLMALAAARLAVIVAIVGGIVLAAWLVAGVMARRKGG
ncbi:hypothetical protein [Labrys neptuniae]